MRLSKWNLHNINVNVRDFIEMYKMTTLPLGLGSGITFEVIYQKYYYWSVNVCNMQKLRKWHLSYKIIILPLKATLLDLISKNYHIVKISFFSRIRNLYINLT